MSMRSIDVSTDVFARIWAERKSGEDTENTILLRILMISYRDEQPAPTMHIQVNDMAKVTWRDDVVTALQSLGGKARLGRIYETVTSIRREAGRTVPPSIDATVRRTLEDHCSDSDNFRGVLDLFRMPEGRGAGVWSIR